MSNPQPDTAGVIARPPLIFAAVVGAGLLLNRVRPLPTLPAPFGRPLGAVLAAAGVGLGAAAGTTLKRAGTDVRTREQTSVIVEGGPYRFSRNPIYLGMTLLGGGVGLLANAGWVLALLPAAVTVVQKGVVEREEAYLARRFPNAYPAYKGRVRRWV